MVEGEVIHIPIKERTLVHQTFSKIFRSEQALVFTLCIRDYSLACFHDYTIPHHSTQMPL